MNNNWQVYNEENELIQKVTCHLLGTWNTPTANKKIDKIMKVKNLWNQISHIITKLQKNIETFTNTSLAFFFFFHKRNHKNLYPLITKWMKIRYQQRRHNICWTHQDITLIIFLWYPLWRLTLILLVKRAMNTGKITKNIIFSVSFCFAMI